MTPKPKQQVPPLSDVLAGVQPDAATAHWASMVKTGVFWPSLIGALILGVFVGGFGIWASQAPLAGAVIAPGVIQASGQNLKIQHFEGGIIDNIMVSEGDAVTIGQPLLRLDQTEAKVTRDRLQKSLVASLARAERLAAERDGVVALAFSSKLAKKADKLGLKNTLDEQQNEFQKRRERVDADGKILEQGIAATREKIVGLKAQIKAVRTQIAILDDDIKRKNALLRKGLTRKTEVNLLKRNSADLKGEIGTHMASIAEAKTSIVETRQRQLKVGADVAEAANTQLNEVRLQISDVEERLRAAENVLNRIVVRAPSDGLVVTLNKNTKGSVVRPGEDLLVLLPSGGELIVEARISPADVDLVTVGQVASLRFSTLNSRTTPEVSGTVSFISPDRVIDPSNNEPYFPARLSIAEVLPEEIKREQIFPGMPVETYIETGTRTFLEYLTKPITDSFRRAFLTD